MNAGLECIHSVSIAGCVREKPGTIGLAALRGDDLRLAGALVEIVAGPTAFEALRRAQAAALAAGARLRRGRCDRTYSQADGIYFFTDLPPGPYRLRVSAPQYGTRFGTVDSGPEGGPDGPQAIRVLPPPQEGQPWQVAVFDVLLPSTRVRGRVLHADTGEAISMAAVRLRGEAAASRTDREGKFELRRLSAGRITLDIAAAGLRPVQRTFTVGAGEEVEIDDIHMSKAGA